MAVPAYCCYPFPYFSSPMVYVLFVLGLAFLIGGAEALVRGAARLAAAAGITPLVIGLTVVAFGTSSPEMTVSAFAAMEGQAGADIALGNVVGSNIFNILFILGLAAVIAPLTVAQKLVRIDVPIMIGLSVLLFALGWDGALSRGDGLLLFGGVIAYTTLAIWQGRRENRQVAAEYEDAFGEKMPRGRIWVNLILIVGGLALLVVGSRWLVNGAVAMAQGFGVSELIISLTIVAAGTSLPEVAASVLASLRGERDIAVGNVIGSSIFNLLAVLGLSATVAPDGINVPRAALAFDVPVMTAAAVMCLPIFFTGYRIGRMEGLLFLGYYVAYVAYLILAANQHAALPLFSAVMIFAVVPATLLVLLIAVLKQARKKAS